MKLSVVIPVHNCEAHLGDAVKCLRNQDFADWEAVVVDDGSTDATPQVADDLARQDGRVRVVHQPNGGVSVARNRGLDEARGDWIAWLDADDAYVPGALRRIAELADANPGCNCLQFPYNTIQPDGSLHPCVPPAYSEFGGKGYPGLEAFDILFARKNVSGMNWQPWRFVYRRDSLPRFRAGVIHEDVDVLPLQLAGFACVYIANEPLYAYLPARTGATTETFTPRRVRDILDVTAHVYAQLETAGLPAALRRGFTSTLACNLFGFYLATPGFPEPDRTELLDAFAAHPEWLRAIDWPPRTAWLKRLFLRVLGVRLTARLVGRLTGYRGLHGGGGR